MDAEEKKLLNRVKMTILDELDKLFMTAHHSGIDVGIVTSLVDNYVNLNHSQNDSQQVYNDSPEAKEEAAKNSINSLLTALSSMDGGSLPALTDLSKKSSDSNFEEKLKDLFN